MTKTYIIFSRVVPGSDLAGYRISGHIIFSRISGYFGRPDSDIRPDNRYFKSRKWSFYIKTNIVIPTCSYESSPNSN